MEQKKKNDNIVSMLLDAFNTGVKKAVEQEKLQDEVPPAEQIKVLTAAINKLNEVVQHHNTAINELYLLQAHILKQIKPSSSSVDSLSLGLGTTKKNNDEKPN